LALSSLERSTAWGSNRERRCCRHAWIDLVSGTTGASITAGKVALDEAASSAVVWVPTICLVEIIYLTERNRVPANTLDLVLSAVQTPGSGFLLAPLDLGVVNAVRAIRGDLVPEMPDRVIAATALSLDAALVTADSEIRAARVVDVIW
jgi:PIN domain nuclease of toxin-antitoxin system